MLDRVSVNIFIFFSDKLYPILLYLLFPYICLQVALILFYSKGFAFLKLL